MENFNRKKERKKERLGNATVVSALYLRKKNKQTNKQTNKVLVITNVVSALYLRKKNKQTNKQSLGNNHCRFRVVFKKEKTNKQTKPC